MSQFRPGLQEEREEREEREGCLGESWQTSRMRLGSLETGDP